MAVEQATGPKPDEQTPLLTQETPQVRKYGKSVLYRALLCGFMVSSSFGVTQVPLIYVFRLMTCEAYYDTHDDNSVPGSDRCNIHSIEADTARAVALLGASTTLFGVANLFVTGWAIKKFGIKSALLMSVFWPAVRLAVQNIGVQVGGALGILIIQCSQIITVVGGPAGYILALNSFVTEVIEHKERTGALGKLQGCTFFGTACAYIAGGLISDHFGIAAPFRVTVVLFLTSCVYVMVFLPWIPITKAAIKAPTGITNFLGPFKMFKPQKWILQNGNIKMQYGTLLLGFGTFLGVLATGYQSVLLQMYATDVYGFGTSENGYLISLNAFVRGVFLTLLFPRIISAGRIWLKSSEPSTSSPKQSAIPDLPSQQNDFAAIEPLDNEQEPIEPPKPTDVQETFHFDLLYTRYSLLADAILTSSAVFINKGWQMYPLAGILSLAAGTGSAAKGTILQMCPPSERTDALSAITLVEMLARLSTTTVFGLVFAAFAQVGMTYMVFACNGAVALLGFAVLLLSHFPPHGSRKLDDGDSESESEPSESI